MIPDKDPIDVLSKKLATILFNKTNGRKQTNTEIKGLTFYREENIAGCSVCVVEPSIAIVVQGEKRMSLDKNNYRYDPYKFLITSLDLPANMEVLKASPEEPYLGLVLKFDLKLIGELILQSPDIMSDTPTSEPGMTLGNMTPELLDGFLRLVSLLEDPSSIPVLAPLIEREIYWRLLMSEQGSRLKQIVSSGSKSHRIAKSIEWLKIHYNQPFRVEEMAEIAQMSSSTFHQHFRELTAMSPLQYQKHLRLTEARRLMLGENFDAAEVAYHVGYESPSQFSREYSRLFGAPPKRDIEALRQNQI